MLQYLTWAEILLKLGGGLAFGLFPITTIRLFGLPAPAGPFWPRLLASVLVGLGLATFLHATIAPGKGLGLAGSMAINLTAAAMIAAQLTMAQAAKTRRGNAALWCLAAGLVGLSLVELAYI